MLASEDDCHQKGEERYPLEDDSSPLPVAGLVVFVLGLAVWFLADGVMVNHQVISSNYSHCSVSVRVLHCNWLM